MRRGGGYGGRHVFPRAVKALLFRVPSGRFVHLGDERRGVRMLAVSMVRDEARYLPGMLRNIGAQVDGLVALDDGSTDGSDRILEASPCLLELLRNPPHRPGYDEQGGHRRLVEAALRHGADWIVSLDADERLERGFRARAERVIRRGARLGLKAFEVRLRELWDSRACFRTDGIWGWKWSPRLFRALPGHGFDGRALHGAKAPRQGRVLGVFPLADLIIYHLRMVSREDREARRRRYESLDPDERFQSRLGYTYLTDERGLALRPVPAGRDFEE